MSCARCAGEAIEGSNFCGPCQTIATASVTLERALAKLRHGELVEGVRLVQAAQDELATA